MCWRGALRPRPAWHGGPLANRKRAGAELGCERCMRCTAWRANCRGARRQRSGGLVAIQLCYHKVLELVHEHEDMQHCDKERGGGGVDTREVMQGGTCDADNNLHDGTEMHEHGGGVNRTGTSAGISGTGEQRDPGADDEHAGDDRACRSARRPRPAGWRTPLDRRRNGRVEERHGTCRSALRPRPAGGRTPLDRWNESSR